MTDIMASIGLVQLDRYDELLSKRRRIVKLYEEGLCNLPVKWLSHSGSNFESSHHLFLMTVDNANVMTRNRIIEVMVENGVSCNVHYKPLPLLTAYKRLGFDSYNFPNAMSTYQKEITLPLHTLMTENDVEYVIQTLSKILSFESNIN